LCSPIPRSRAEPRVHCQLRATKYKPETGKIPRDWITLRAPTHTELATYGIEGYLSTSRAQPWLLQRGGQVSSALSFTTAALDQEEVDDLDDAPDDEVAAAEEEILDQATAARSIVELKAEIGTLQHLESLALEVRRSGADTKWLELASLLNEIFASAPQDPQAHDDARPGRA
jgi:hypothetical protein